MGVKAILINDPPGGTKRPVADQALGWSLLWIVGWLFVAVGLLNIVLLWWPLQMGNPEYEFASVAAMLDSLPLPTMGLAFALAASRASGRSTSAKVAMVIAVVVAVLVVLAAVLYGLAVPLALKAVKEGPIRLRIMKSILKVSAQAVLYPIALLAFARLANQK